MGKKILVVDDDPLIRFLIRDYLTAYGHEVEVQESGTDCLESLQGELPDILILDLIMRDMTGIDVLRRIRLEPRTSDLKIIMLSADDNVSDLAGLENVAADRYMGKPFDLKSMLAVINGIPSRKM